MGENLIIVIQVFGFLNNQTPYWEHSGFSLVEIIGKNHFPLCDDEIRVLCESLEEITPLKNERWHELTLKRIYSYGGYNHPDECQYKKINIELVPLRCLNCGALLDKRESEMIDEYGVEPYCGQYCAAIGNGIPMPVSRGALTFDRIFNNP